MQVHASSLQKALPEVDAILVGGKQYGPVQQSHIDSAFMHCKK